MCWLEVMISWLSWYKFHQILTNPPWLLSPGARARCRRSNDNSACNKLVILCFVMLCLETWVSATSCNKLLWGLLQQIGQSLYLCHVMWVSCNKLQQIGHVMLCYGGLSQQIGQSLFMSCYWGLLQYLADVQICENIH